MANAVVVEGLCGGEQCLHVKIVGRLRIRKALLVEEPLMHAYADVRTDETLPPNFFVRPPMEIPEAPIARHRPGLLWFQRVSEDPDSQVLADDCRMLFFRLPVERYPLEKDRFLIHERADLQPMLSFLKRIVYEWSDFVEAGDLHSVSVFSLLQFYLTEANAALPSLKPAAKAGACIHCDGPAAAQQCVCAALFCNRTCHRISWPVHRMACLLSARRPL